MYDFIQLREYEYYQRKINRIKINVTECGQLNPLTVINKLCTTLYVRNSKTEIKITA